jgi:hypothetical protein
MTEIDAKQVRRWLADGPRQQQGSGKEVEVRKVGDRAEVPENRRSGTALDVLPAGVNRERGSAANNDRGHRDARIHQLFS